RTLKILLQSGFIRQSKIEGMARYEPLIKQPNHLHFICNICRSTVEFPSRRIENLIRQVTDEYEFDERYSGYVIFGICKACFRQQRKLDAFNGYERFETYVVCDAIALTLALERHGSTG